MLKQPLVSVIIPTYNRAHLIGETLDSVLAQTYENWECIVVDDGSTDNTDEVMAAYCAKDSRFRYYHRPDTHKPGGNGARNFGFLMSKGEYVQWTDSDDLMHPEKLAKQVHLCMGKNASVSVCRVLFFREDLDDVFEPKNNTIISDSPLSSYVRDEITIYINSCVWSRNFLMNSHQLFNEDLKAAQEWEFHSRLLALNPDITVIDDELMFIRSHSGNMTNGKVDQRKWNYFLARLVIYKSIQLDNETKLYLQSYMNTLFKRFVTHRYKKYVFPAFFSYVLKEKTISRKNKALAFIALFTYLFFKRGSFFLRNL